MDNDAQAELMQEKLERALALQDYEMAAHYKARRDALRGTAPALAAVRSSVAETPPRAAGPRASMVVLETPPGSPEAGAPTPQPYKQAKQEHDPLAHLPFAQARPRTTITQRARALFLLLFLSPPSPCVPA